MTTPGIAFVLTAGEAAIDADAIAASYGRLVPGAARLAVESAEPGRAVVVPEGTDLRFTLGTVPRPLPDGAAEADVRFSVSTFGTPWQLPPHHGQVMVVNPGDSLLRPDHALTVFTVVVAAVAEAAGAVGIHWRGAPATHEPRFFGRIAARATEQPPVALWTGVSLTRAAGRISLLSRGLAVQLDLPDLLLTAPAGQDDAALAVFFELLDDMVRRYRAPADGETVGRSQVFKVSYVASPAGDGSTVMRVASP